MAGTETAVTIPGEVTLAGVLHLPDGVAPPGGVVVCHPHTLYGGTLRTAVVARIARQAAKSGLAVLRFDFRGAGSSGGAYDGGRGETRDVAAALSFLRERLGAGRPLALAGYSFGAVVAASYVAGQTNARAPDLRALALVGLPVRLTEFKWLDLAPLRDAGVRVLAVVGEEDELGGPAAVTAALAPVGERATVAVVPRAGHAFVGHRLAVGEIVVDFLRAAIRLENGAGVGPQPDARLGDARPGGAQDG